MLFYHPDLSHSQFELSSEESGHIVRVLRLKQGDQIEITDGQGHLVKAAIINSHHKKCKVEIINQVLIEDRPIPLHIAIAPTKNIDRITWFVEKAVEIGIQEISFPICLHNERKTINIDKIRTKAISALKQSKGVYLPVINPPISYVAFMKKIHPEKEKYIAHVRDTSTRELNEAATSRSSYLVLIGPEGDFTDEEISIAENKLFQVVKMGNKRLRTETAALHACSMLNALNY